MNQQFDTLKVSRLLGVAPSTASIISGLLEGKINPDNCRSIEYWPFADLEAPPQHEKVMAAIASLLELESDDVVKGKGFTWLEYMEGQPTIIWTGVKFVIGRVSEQK